MKKNYILLVIIIITNYINLQSQTFTKKVYNLSECLKIAQIQNYDLQISQANTQSIGYELTNAFGNYLPGIDFNMGYSRTLNPEGTKTTNINGLIIELPGQNPNSYYMQAQASLMIFDGFNREGRYSNIQNRLESAIENNKFVSQFLIKKVYVEYIDVVKAYQIVKLRNEDFNQAKQELEKIKSFYQAGAIPVNEVYSQEANIGLKEIEIIKAENNLKLAKSRLLNTLGLSPNLDVEFDISSIPTKISIDDIEYFKKEIGNINSAIEMAYKNRSDLKAKEYQLKASEDGITVARSSYMPKLMASGGWTWNNSQFSDFSKNARSFISLNFNLPIFSNFNSDYLYQTSKVNYLISELENKKAIQDILIQIQNAYLNLEAAEKQIEISERSVKSAELNYNSMRERYNLGAANITELTLANNQYIVAQINQISAYYDYLTAQKELQFAIGILK